MINQVGFERNSFLKYLPVRIRTEFSRLPEAEQKNIAEIRLRLGQLPSVTGKSGRINVKLWQDSSPVTRGEMEEALRLLTGSSVYALENDLKNGFITVPGGHRIGIGGTAVVRGGRIKTQKEITSLNYRLAREIIGVGNRLLPYMYRQNEVLNTLIFSPPGAGKTTLLRDLIRLIADGNSYGSPRNVAVIDERKEIGGVMMGQASFHLGAHTDILSGFPKAEGMSLAIRSLAPEVIAADEIGTEAEIGAAMDAVGSGVSLLMTAHGSTLEELRERPLLKLWMEKGLFSQIVGLKKEQQPGIIANIYRKSSEGSGYYDTFRLCGCDFSGNGQSRYVISK